MLALYEATHYRDEQAVEQAPGSRPSSAPPPTPHRSRTSWASPGHRAAFVRGSMAKGSTAAGLAWLMGG